MRNAIIREIKKMLKNAESYAAFVNAFMHYQEKVISETNYFIVWIDETDVILIGNILSNLSTQLDLSEEINALN